MIEYKSGTILTINNQMHLVSSDGHFYYLINLDDNCKVLEREIGLHFFSKRMLEYPIPSSIAQPEDYAFNVIFNE